MSSLKFYHISRCLQLYPLNFDVHVKKGFKIFHYFTIPTVIVAMIGLFTWNYVSKHKTFFIHITASYGIIGTCINSLLTLSNITCILMVQTHSDSWQILFKSLIRNQTRDVVNNAYFFIMHCLFLILPSMEVYLYSFDFYSLVSTQLMDNVNFYMLLTTVMLINGYARNIYLSVVNVANGLRQETRLLVKLKAIGSGAEVLKHFGSVSRIDHILLTVVDVLKEIDAFNNVYGFQILAIASIIMLFITDTFNSIFFFVSLQQLTIEVIFRKCYYSFVLLILGLLVVAPCFETTNQFDEIVKVLCKLLMELPRGQDDSQSKSLKSKLLLLVKQLEFRKPYFSAAGFFEVNYEMFMYIFGGITSFVVVYVQLRN